MTNEDMQAFLDSQRDGVAKAPDSQGEEALTIATGVITPTRSLVEVETEASAGADDLTNIATTNFQHGDFLFLRAKDAAHVVTLKSNANGSDGALLGLNFQDLALHSKDTVVVFRLDKVAAPTKWIMTHIFPGALSAPDQTQFQWRNGLSHGVVEFTADDSWTVPFGVTQIEIYAESGKGGGGEGADATDSGNDGDDGEDTVVTNGTWTITVNGGKGGHGGRNAGIGGQDGPGGLPNGNPGGPTGWAIGGYSVVTPGGWFSGQGSAGGAGGGSGGSGGAEWTRQIKEVAQGESVNITIGAGGTGGTGGSTRPAAGTGDPGRVIIRFGQAGLGF